jgi:hypothetical protein
LHVGCPFATDITILQKQVEQQCRTSHCRTAKRLKHFANDLDYTAAVVVKLRVAQFFCKELLKRVETHAGKQAQQLPTVRVRHIRHAADALLLRQVQHPGFNAATQTNCHAPPHVLLASNFTTHKQQQQSSSSSSPEHTLGSSLCWSHCSSAGRVTWLPRLLVLLPQPLLLLLLPAACPLCCTSCTTCSSSSSSDSGGE